MTYVTVNANKEAFAVQGRYIRSTGIERSYHRIYLGQYSQSLVHNNFFVRYDPAYNFSKLMHRYDEPNRAVPIYQPEENVNKEAILDIYELNVIAGIVHSAYLRFLSELKPEWNKYPIDQELPPKLIDWNVVITLRTPRVLGTFGTPKLFYRSEVINRINQGEIGQITFVDQAYSDGKVDILPIIYMKSEKLPYSFPFTIGIHKSLQETFIHLTISKEYQFAIYSTLSEAMMTKLIPLDGNVTEKWLTKIFKDSGLGPILSGKTAKDTSILKVSQKPSTLYSTIDTLVPIMNLSMLYRNKLISENGRNITNIPIPEEDFRDIVVRGTKVLGSDNMINVAIACINLYNIMKKPDQRLLTFATLVDENN